MIPRKYREEYKAQPTPTVILDLKGPGGEWAAYSSYVESAKAEEAAARWKALLGADRVSTRPYGTFRRD